VCRTVCKRYRDRVRKNKFAGSKNDLMITTLTSSRSPLVSSAMSLMSLAGATTPFSHALRSVDFSTGGTTPYIGPHPVPSKMTPCRPSIWSWATVLGCASSWNSLNRIRAGGRNASYRVSSEDARNISRLEPGEFSAEKAQEVRHVVPIQVC
jgi:hypothetical protein